MPFFWKYHKKTLLLNKTRISEISKCCTTWLLKSKTNYFCTNLLAIFWGQKWDYEVGLWSLRLSGSIKNHINCFMWYFSVYIIFSSAKWNTRSLCKKSVSDTSDLIVMLFTLIKVNSTLKYRIKEQYGINEQGELFSEN